MGLKVFYRFSHRSFGGGALVIASGLLGGCSSDFTRLTDGIYTGSTVSQQAVVQRPVSQHQQMPPAVQGVAYGAIESSELPPLSVPNCEPMIQTASVGIGIPPVPVSSPRISERRPASETKSAAKVVGSDQSQVQRPDQNRTYIVQGGDTLYGISRRNNTSVDQLKRDNGLSGDLIRIGQRLTVPGEGQTPAHDLSAPDIVVAKAAVPIPAPEPALIQAKSAADAPISPAREIETVTVKPEMKQPEVMQETEIVAQVKKAVATEEDTQQKAQEVSAFAPAASGISSALMRWPARGRILSRYGQREGTTTNDGMDIMVPEGTPVRAADSGVVIYAGDGLKEFGNTILIRHEDNVVTVYGHNSKILVHRGQEVHRGDEIAKSGMSGNASTPRLHFEVRKNSAPVNPVKYLEN